MLAAGAAPAADVDVTTDDGVRHQLWPIADEDAIGRLTGAVDSLSALYIADGHHRSAAAARVAQARGNGAASHHYFLAVLFPHHEMTILDYNPVLRALNGPNPDQLPAQPRERLSVETARPPVRP